MKLVKETKRFTTGEITIEKIPGKVWKNKRFYLDRKGYIDLETKQYYVSRPCFRSNLFYRSEWIPTKFLLNEWIRIYGTDIVVRYSIEEKQDLKDGKEMEAKMRKIQKIIIIVYGILVAVACVYVPWRTRLPSPNSNLIISIGYSPLWSPSKSSYMPSEFSVIDYGKIILELIAITTICAILFVLTLRHRQKEE